MATIQGAITYNDDGTRSASWANLTNTNADGSPVSIGRNRQAVFQAVGTIGTSGHITVEGSNDGETWVALHDSFGNAIDLTAAGFAFIRDLPAYVRPHVTAGTGSTLSVFAFSPS